MTKVHAFQIREVECTSWMISDWCYGFQDQNSYRAFGYEEKQVVPIPKDMYHLFKPEAGHYLIVWPHGLITFRTAETFDRDFHHVGGTVYETKYKALFQEGMCTAEYKAQQQREREERLEKYQAEWQRRKEADANTPDTVEIAPGVIAKRVRPGLVEAPRGIAVQPLSGHVANLALLIRQSPPSLE